MDALVPDPCRAELSDRLPLRGSDNQRLHLSTARGRARYADYLIPGTKVRALDQVTDGEGEPVIMADLGYVVMDEAMVEAATYAKRKRCPT